jgi:two-component system NtrC family sensor kinase
VNKCLKPIQSVKSVNPKKSVLQSVFNPWLAVSVFFVLISFFSEAQNIFSLPDPADSAIILNEGWTYHMGDDPNIGNIDYDGDSWKPIQPVADIVDSIPADVKTGVGWMRLKFRVSNDARNQQLGIMVRQSVASEIYLNGKRIAQYGVVSASPSDIVADDPRYEPVQLEISNDSIQVLAVRFAVQSGIGYSNYFGTINPFCSIRVMRNDMAIEQYKVIYMRPWMDLFMQGTIFMVFIVHFSFFIMLPVQRANLYFALAALFQVIGAMVHNYYYYSAPPDQKFISAVITSVFHTLTQIFIFTSVHRYLKLRTNILFWILVALSSLGVIVGAAWYDKGFKIVTGWTPLICYLFIIFISIVAQKNRVKEARILTIGFWYYASHRPHSGTSDERPVLYFSVLYFIATYGGFHFPCL